MKDKTTFYYTIAVLAWLAFLFIGDAIIYGRIHHAPFRVMILNYAIQCVELGFLGFFLAPKKQWYGYVYLVGFLVCIGLAITWVSGLSYWKILLYYYLSWFALLAWAYAGEDAVRMLTEMDADPMVQHDLVEIERLKWWFKTFAERAKEQAAMMRSAKPLGWNSEFWFPGNPNMDIINGKWGDGWWDPEYWEDSQQTFSTVPQWDTPAPAPDPKNIPF